MSTHNKFNVLPIMIINNYAVTGEYRLVKPSQTASKGLDNWMF